MLWCGWADGWMVGWMDDGLECLIFFLIETSMYLLDVIINSFSLFSLVFLYHFILLVALPDGQRDAVVISRL